MTYVRYICTMCSYVLDNDPAAVAVRGMSFEEIPSSWQCPGCEAAKEKFEGCACEHHDLFEASRIQPATSKTAKERLHICTLCNYVHEDPEDNQSEMFANLPESWTCPECRASKAMFASCSCVVCDPAEIKVVDTKIDEQRTIASLVMENTSRAAVFETFGIDYCCGGKQSLEAACSSNGSNLLEVKTALASCDDSPPGTKTERDLSQLSIQDLISNIQRTHHRYLQSELPSLVQLVGKVARVHGKRHNELDEVLNTFVSLSTELLAHVAEEDSSAFPAIIKAAQNGTLTQDEAENLQELMAKHTQEHEEAGGALSKIKRLTNNYTVPSDGCTSYDLMMKSLRTLDNDLHLHVSKENNLLYPEVDSLVRQIGSRAIAAQLA